jgi:hypothetical protein
MLWVLLMFGDPVTPVAFLGLLVTAVGVLLVLGGRRAVTAGTPDPAPPPKAPHLTPDG